MLRINLLPAYVTQRRLTQRLSLAFALLFIVCVAVPLAIYFSLKTQLATITDKANQAVNGKKITDQLRETTAATNASVDPLTAKIQFVQDVHKSTVSWVKLYNTLADTSAKSRFIYTDASVSGTTMTIKAYSPSVEEVGRYLQAMYREPDFQTVAVDKVPGYPDNVRRFYYLDGTLVFADGVTNTNAPGGPSITPVGAPPGGQSAGGAGSGPSIYNPDTLGPNGPGNIPPGVGPPPPELTGVAPTGGTAPGGQATDEYSPKFLAIAGKNISPFALPEVRDKILKLALRRVVVKTVSKGFDITVTAILNDDVQKSLTAPPLPGTAPAATGNKPVFGIPPGGPNAQG